jgi:flagellar hook-associated protein 3 FlgL
MLSTISPAGQEFLNSLNDIQTRLNTAQQQITTGLKVNAPSDAPDEISPILQLHTAIQQNQSIQDNLNTVSTEVTASANALSNSVELLQNANVIATQATSLNQTSQTRAALAQSVQGLLERMVANSRTTVEGRYVFSGDLDQTPLYDLNLASPTGVNRLQVASATKLVQGPGGTQFSASLSGNSIFDHRDANDVPDSSNVFAALNGLRTALLNDDTAGINSSLDALNSASNYLNSQLAFYGQAQNRIASGLDQTKTAAVQLRSELSGKTDADLAEAITALTEGQNQLQAALSARARMPHTSLFDVLPIG